MISQNLKITRALAYASGTADRDGAVLDMAGWDGVLCVVHFAVIASSATTQIEMQQGAASNMSDAADLTGTGVTVADDDDDEVFYIDLYQPQERYVRLYIEKNGAQASAESAVYYQYKGKYLPSTHAAGVTGEMHASPAEGTA